MADLTASPSAGGIPPAVASRIKSGWMVKPAEREDAWTLYEPLSDTRCGFTLDPHAGSGLSPADLESDDRAWSDQGLQLDVYHHARSLRAHTALREVNLEINFLCRYGCRHCFQSLIPEGDAAATPSWEMVRGSVDRLLRSNVSEISITGGDIFLHPSIWQLLDYIHERAPRITLRLLINGGGLAMEDPTIQHRLRTLAGRRVLFKSDFFGHTPELHDGFTRVTGSLERLIGIFQFLKAEGIPVIATAALTRMNFEKRFELINFLYNLTNNSFVVSTLIYPSHYPRGADVAGTRLTLDQYSELLEERFFAPLTCEYHSLEPQCDGDCQFSVVSATGEAWGCSFLKLRPSSEDVGPPDGDLAPIVSRWRGEAMARASLDQCNVCPAQPTCRRCPSFLVSAQPNTWYCEPSRQAWAVVLRRVEGASKDGFVFIDAASAARFSVGC